MNHAITRFCSLQFWSQVLQSLLQTFRRFPLAVLALVVINLITLDDIHDINLVPEQQSLNTLLAAIGGAFWFTSTKILAESQQWHNTRFYQLALPVFFVYCWHVTTQNTWTLASLLLIVAAALAITFSAWLFRRNDNASVWYFNYQLIAALCFAVLAGLILCGGISLILVSMGYLFEINISSEIYGDTWLIGMTFLVPFYFLAQIPKQFDYPPAECKFPNGVHFILTYVLVPLALIYMVILYAYFIKILLQWELPRGHLGRMISAFGVIGVITHLAIYPIHDRRHAILSWFYRYFYLIMIVPLGLLSFAIGLRLSQYGVTEQRYLVALCTLWFAILIMTFLIKSHQFRLQQVPISLALLSLLASFGPWGIHQLPVKDQFARLQALLIRENLMLDGKLNVTHQPDFDTRKSISSMIVYLVRHDAGDKLRPWVQDKQTFDKKLACNKRKACHQHDAKQVIKLMGIDYVNPWQHATDIRYKEIALKNLNRGQTSSMFAVDGYDFLIPIDSFSRNKSRSITMLGNIDSAAEFKLVIDKQGQLVLSTHDGNSISFELLKVAAQFSATGSTYVEDDQASKLILAISGQGLSGKLYIDRLNLRDGEIKSLSGKLLVKIHPKR